MKFNSTKAYMALALLVLFGTSCQKEKTTPESEDINNGIVYDENHLAIAQSLIDVFEDDNEMLSYTIDNCFKYFDGDRNVLLSDLIGKTNYIESETLKSTTQNSTKNLFKNSLNQKLSHYSNALKSSSDAQIEEILDEDPSMQLYYYVGNKEDSLSYSGIVIVEDNVDEQRGSHTLITTDGEITTIDRNIEPTSNYLVLSENERITPMLIPIDPIDPFDPIGELPPVTPVNKKYMKIVKARFVSLSAKRMFEPWAYGDAEVRLNVNYTTIDGDNLLARNASYMYPKNWVDSDIFSNWTVWNTCTIGCPTWYKDKQSSERCIMFTEEDGKTTEKEYTQEYTNPLTGEKSTLKIKVPASDDEDLMVQTYIDYDQSSGMIEAGVIRFELYLK